MIPSKLEIINAKEIKIGERVVAYHLHNPPLNNNFHYSIDASANEIDSYTQKLYLHDFREIKPSDLPNGLAISISISSQHSELKESCFFLLEKQSDLTEIGIVADYVFKEWHLPISLTHFTELYKSYLIKTIPNITNVDIETTDIGYFVITKVTAEPNVYIQENYRQLDKNIARTYRKCLAELTSTKENTSKSQASTLDATGFR